MKSVDFVSLRFAAPLFAWALALLATGALLVPDQAVAQPAERLNRQRARVVRVGSHPTGVYGGVQPGVKIDKVYQKSRPVLNRKTKRSRARQGVVRWVGFQPRSSGSRVFVQLTSAVETNQRIEAGVLVVTFEGARLGGSNARRPLDTRFFETPVARASAKRVRKRRARGVELRVRFKNPADASEASLSTSENETDGFTYVFLEFGAGSAVNLGEDDLGEDDDDLREDGEE